MLMTPFASRASPLIRRRRGAKDSSNDLHRRPGTVFLTVTNDTGAHVLRFHDGSMVILFVFWPVRTHGIFVCFLQPAMVYDTSTQPNARRASERVRKHFIPP